MKFLLMTIYLLVPFLFTHSGYYDEVKISTTSEEARILYLNAREYSENMEFGKAILLINKALKIDPDFALAYLLKARQIKNFTDQEYNLHKAEKLSNNISEGEKYLILYYNGVFDSDPVTQQMYLKKLIENYPADKRIQFLAASEKYLSGNFKEALDHLVKVIEIDPFYHPAYNLIGYCKAGLDKGEEKKEIVFILTAF